MTQLLWDRYGPFWTRLVTAAGSEVVIPERTDVTRELREDERLARVEVAAFRLAAAQASALADCDIVIVPELNPVSEAQRGSAQDRWTADLIGALADAVPGLPELRAVPTEIDESVEGAAALLLSRLLREPAAVERVWSRHKALVSDGRWREARSERARAQRVGQAVALVAQPWLITDGVVAAVELSLAEQARVIDPRALKPERLREVGERLELRVLATDAEVIGAARVLSGRSDVSGLVHLVDTASPSYAWLARRVKEHALKPVEEVSLDALLADRLTIDDLIELPVE